MSQVCARCGTINKDESQFCLYCGAPLPMRPTEPPRPAAPSPPRPTPPTPRPMPVARARNPDFVGLFGVAFFLLVIGVVFYLNQNLLNEIRRWWDQILAGRIAFRPPEGLIISAAWFWGLLGISIRGLPRGDRNDRVCVLPEPLLAAGYERLPRDFPRGRLARRAPVHLHRIRIVLDVCKTKGACGRSVSRAAAVTGITVERD